MKFLDPNNTLFRHAWVRWASVLLPLGWGIVEFVVLQSPFWGLLFLAAGVEFFLTDYIKRKFG